MQIHFSSSSVVHLNLIFKNPRKKNHRPVRGTITHLTYWFYNPLYQQWFSRPFQGIYEDLWGQNYFHNKIKIFAFFYCVNICTDAAEQWWVVNCWHLSINQHSGTKLSLYSSLPCTSIKSKQTKPVSPKNVLDDQLLFSFNVNFEYMSL